MDSDTIKGIAQTYFDARRSRDVDRLRSILADDVSFRVRSVPPTVNWSHVETSHSTSELRKDRSGSDGKLVPGLPSFELWPGRAMQLSDQ